MKMSVATSKAAKGKKTTVDKLDQVIEWMFRYYISLHDRKVQYRWHWIRITSIHFGVGEFCFRQSNPVLGCVVDRVESLEEGLAEDEVQTRSTRGANVRNDQINAIGSTTN